MPIYDYECPDCGPFTQMRAMSESADPACCDNCGQPSARAFITAPAVLGMNSDRRRAMAINEESRSSPKVSSKSEKYSLKHRAGCSCCKKPAKRAGFHAESVKSSPSARPWMISH